MQIFMQIFFKYLYLRLSKIYFSIKIFLVFTLVLYTIFSNLINQIFL